MSEFTRCPNLPDFTQVIGTYTINSIADQMQLLKVYLRGTCIVVRAILGHFMEYARLRRVCVLLQYGTRGEMVFGAFQRAKMGSQDMQLKIFFQKYN